METNKPPSITFAQLGGAYTSCLLSETTFLILLSLVSDIPASWSSKTNANRDISGDSASGKPSFTPTGPGT